ncbi:MAG: amidohydrolase [Clostridia bacterium]|nr:amidohydrolase [Clostridia bacterium]
MESKLTELLEWLHQHPETGLEEHETTEKLRQVLQTHGVEVLDSGLPTGLIAVIRGERGDGRIIGLRADIDALPVQEDTGLSYASLNAGKMHACGHDFHAASVMGAALMLHERRGEWGGTVKVVFQPAEEIDAGGRLVMETGLVDDCELFLAGHTYAGFEAGVMGIKEGPVMAAIDRFSVTVTGKGCHAAHPHKGIDPIPALSAMVQSVQSIVSRSMDPFAPGLVSVTHLEAGNTWNVIPETAFMEGTVRTLDAQDRQLAEKRFREIIAGTAAAYGVTAGIDWHHGSPAVVNDPALCVLARKVAQRCGITPAVQENTLGAEDFSLYGQGRPALFVRVGTGGQWPAHHPRFTVDPAALYPTAVFFAEMALACLRGEA